ncbi:MAG: cytidylate kinase-like family protein [Balneolaceae bacterium]
MARKVTQIVEEQIKAWSHRNSSRKPSAPQKKHYPVITISREFGARGAAMAELLGKKTGFKVWDKELLGAIADHLGSDQKLLETLDERRQEIVEDTVAGFIKNIHTNVNYLRTLIRVVKTIEEQGNDIIVGRGANYICQHPSSFHIRVVCPLKKRISEYAKRENISTTEARRIIEQKDRERADFIKSNFYKEVATPSDYDLLINSDTFTLEQMADLVLDAYEMNIGEKVKALA